MDFRHCPACATCAEALLMPNPRRQIVFPGRAIRHGRFTGLTADKLTALLTPAKPSLT
jgi:hypothetical protein